VPQRGKGERQMNETKKTMRLKYFISSGMQLKFLRANILLAIFISLAIAFSVYQLSMNILGPSLEEVYPAGIVNDIYKNLDSSLTVRLFFIILIVIIATFLISHRVAGPAYHIERDLSTMTEGDLTKRIYLRKHDELKPIATKINKMADMVSQGLNSIDKNLETMGKLNEELRSEKLAASLKGAKDVLSQFRIK